MILKKNIGYIDSIIRVIIGAIAVGLGLYFDNYWGFLGLLLVISGTLSFSPLYRVLNISTMDPNLEREN